ncbi:dihydrodipicolinate synthase family protein [Oscillospiraceae bacterium HV4-5-C5C]|nr:dihydrodipicolinate synthase family protein [Oscillospiraceae bacterium HV4-5-C5C]
MQSIHNGVWPTMLTPFTRSGAIDYPGVEELLRFYAERQVDGLFALCQSSEMFYLSLQERQALLGFICEHRYPGQQIIASGHVADGLQQQIDEARALVRPELAAYVVLPNRFAAETESDDVLLERLDHFVRAVPDIPLGIYECPYPYKRLVSPKVLAYCLESGRFIFLKDTSCDLEQIQQKLELISGSDFKLFNANSATLLDSLRLGAHGYCGVMANIHPEFYVWLYRHFAADPAGAERVQQFVGAASMAEYQYYPVNAKYSLALQGVHIGLDSRTKDSHGFKPSQRLEMQQLTELSRLARGWLGLA